MRFEDTPLYKRTLLPQIKDQTERSIPSLGIPTMVVASHETNGTLPRADKIKPIHEALSDIYQESLRLGAVDSVRVTEEISAEVSSTFPASGHTPYGVNHDEAQACWDKTRGENAGYANTVIGHMVKGTEEGHAKYVPAQLITWVMLKLKTGPGPKDYVMAPVDVYELAQVAQDGEISIKFNNEEKTVHINNEMLTQIYTSVGDHLRLHKEYLTSLYNQHILPEMNKRLAGLGIVLGERDIRSLVNTMALGYSRDEKKESGLGGGPQSNPTAHIHTTMYPDLDELRRLVIERFIPDPRRELDARHISKSGKFSAKALFRTATALEANPEITDEELIAELSKYTDIKLIHRWLRQEYGWAGHDDIDTDAIKRALLQKSKEVNLAMKQLKYVFAFGEPVLGGLSFKDPEAVPPHVIFKQVDPYSTIFNEHMDSWVQGELQKAFYELGVSQDKIKSFKWETQEYRFDMRVTEGWEIAVPNADFARVNLSLNQFLGKINALWQEGRDAWATWQTRRDTTQLQALQTKYGLSQETITLIKKIKPTDQQLQDWFTSKPLGSTDEDMDRFMHQIIQRLRPEFRARAMERIQTHPDLATRATMSGLFEILENGQANGNVYSRDTNTFNHGLNIPGVPSFGIAYAQDNGGWKIRIHPLISEKGLAEFIAGCQFIREKGN